MEKETIRIRGKSKKDLAGWKTKPDPDLAERLRQFECVCVVKINLIKQIGNKTRFTGDLMKIGKEMFGLAWTEMRYCLGRAYNFLGEVRELARIRARRGLPIDSDAMLAAIKERERKAA